jgi:hypothetical protein
MLVFSENYGGFRQGLFPERFSRFAVFPVRTRDYSIGSEIGELVALSRFRAFAICPSIGLFAVFAIRPSAIKKARRGLTRYPLF